MCFKTIFTYSNCGDLVDPDPTRESLAWIRPSEDAYSPDQQLQDLCEDKHVIHETVQGTCPSCLAKPTVFRTKEMQDHLANWEGHDFSKAQIKGDGWVVVKRM